MAEAVLDCGPLGLSVAMTLKLLYLESAVLLNAVISETTPELGSTVNFVVWASEY